MDKRIYPLTFTPVLRDYIWGGRRFETLYGRKLPPGVVAESWEISGHSVAPTAVEAGYWKGQALPTIFDELGESLVGSNATWALERHRFPLLVKLLDANQDLSLQVHPDDVYARQFENGEMGKTEMWYILYAEPNAELILGVRPGTTRRAFRAALQSGDLEPVLRRVPVHTGQAVPVPSGALHALMAGVVATEIQQNSDTTYRIHDWGRVGPDGQPRPLHIDKALEVIDFDEAVPGVAVPRALSELPGFIQSELVRTDYFVVEEVRLEKGISYIGACEGVTMEIWGCMAGEVTVEWAGDPVTLPAIRYALLPATLGEFRIVARKASTCLRIYLP